MFDLSMFERTDLAQVAVPVVDRIAETRRRSILHSVSRAFKAWKRSLIDRKTGTVAAPDRATLGLLGHGLLGAVGGQTGARFGSPISFATVKARIKGRKRDVLRALTQSNRKKGLYQ